MIYVAGPCLDKASWIDKCENGGLGMSLFYHVGCGYDSSHKAPPGPSMCIWWMRSQGCYFPTLPQVDRWKVNIQVTEWDIIEKQLSLPSSSPPFTLHLHIWSMPFFSLVCAPAGMQVLTQNETSHVQLLWLYSIPALLLQLSTENKAWLDCCEDCTYDKWELDPGLYLFQILPGPLKCDV